MKSFKFFIVSLGLITILTQCTDQLSDPEEELREEYERYMAEHPDAHIEYATLDELNAIYAEYGLPILTEKDFSHDEWIYLQNPEKYARPRCSGTWAVFYGDMDNNGTLSTYDLVLADIGINQGCGGTNVTNCPAQYNRFAQFDHKFINGELPFPAGGGPINNPDFGPYNLDHECDVERARQVVLGIISCQ